MTRRADPQYTPQTVRALARKIVRYEELLKLLSSLGDTLRQDAARETAGNDGHDEVAVVRRSSDALAAALTPFAFAFYCADDDGETARLARVLPEESEDFPATTQQPEAGIRGNLEIMPLVGNVVGLAYWHLPSVGRKWALVLRPTDTGYIDPTVSFSIKLFGDCLAGISAARAREAARLHALEDAVFRLLDEQQVVLSVQSEHLRQSARDLHLKLQDLQTMFGDRGIPRKRIAGMVGEVHAAREAFKRRVTELSQSMHGLRPSCLGVREQLEPERDAQLTEILGNRSGVDWGDVDESTWVTTRPAALRRAVQFFQGELCEVVRVDLPLVAFDAEAAAIPTPRLAKGPSGELYIDLICNPERLDKRDRGELPGLLRQLVGSEPSGDTEFSRFQPLACWSLVYYLKNELGITVTVHNDSLRLTIPANRVHWPDAPHAARRRARHRPGKP